MIAVKKIAKTDLVMAKLSWNGITLASIANRNFSSVEEVVKMITSLAGKCFGLAKLTIRNKTQGWAINMGISTPTHVSIKTFTNTVTAKRGTQLALPF